MTFTEKSAWVMIAALIVSGGIYLSALILQSQALGQTAPPNIGILAISVIIIIAIAIFGHAVAALGNPFEANEPEDERDRIVAWRSGNLSGYVLGFGAMTGLFHYAFLNDGNLLFHTIIIALWISQLMEYALMLFFYRRGV